MGYNVENKFKVVFAALDIFMSVEVVQNFQKALERVVLNVYETKLLGV